MDTSETYIKMRVAAIPDLGTGVVSLLPFHFVKATPDFHKQVLIDAKGDWYHIDGDEECQLGRQDQLQEMMGIGDAEDFMEYMEQFTFAWGDSSGMTYPEWAVGSYEETKRVDGRNTSMEQLWLAFVMKENHNKVWKDGWVLSV